jgi:hypothetical protein
MGHQLHAPAFLLLGKSPLIPIGEKTGWQRENIPAILGCYLFGIT